MIKVFTLSDPNPKIKDFASEIFSLGKGAYNLPTRNHPKQKLFDELYKLEVRQIIHDGKSDEIQCVDGYLYAQNLALGQPIKAKDMLVIKKAQ